jgi:hypothetical protein
MSTRMSPAVVFLSALLFLSGSVSRGDDPDRGVPLNPKPGVYRCGADVYTLTDLPRAEGKPVQVGLLSRANSAVAGGDYHRLELPIGSFIWDPPTAGRSEVGWTRIDPRRKHSRWTMASIDTRKDAEGRWITLPRDPITEPPPKPAAPTRRGQ